MVPLYNYNKTLSAFRPIKHRVIIGSESMAKWSIDSEAMRVRGIIIINYYHLKQIFVSFHWPRAHQVTCK